jgi:glycerol-3-phosphate acyltransferase PlsY
VCAKIVKILLREGAAKFAGGKFTFGGAGCSEKFHRGTTRAALREEARRFAIRALTHIILMLLSILITIAAGYVIGAIPVGYLVARSKGIDIFKYGSGNPGATNVMRALIEKHGAAGKRTGHLVFALDALKGAAATGWPFFIAAHSPWDTMYALPLIGFVSVMLGNSFSCFTRFKGGKGVSTGAGGFLVLMPASIAIALLAWVVIFETTRYVSLGSIIATATLPVTSLVTNLAWGFPPMVVVGLSAAATVFVAVRHRANIARLLNGTENKFVKQKTPVGAPDQPS